MQYNENFSISVIKILLKIYKIWSIFKKNIKKYMLIRSYKRKFIVIICIYWKKYKRRSLCVTAFIKSEIQKIKNK